MSRLTPAGAPALSELAESLATVAIASLGGPTAASAAALAEGIKHAKNLLTANAPAMRLRTDVTEAVSAWAAGEEMDAARVRIGLSWAVDAIAAAAVDLKAIASEDFVGSKVAGRVITHMRVKDVWWGSELEHPVAERAIAETYAIICRRLRDDGGVLLVALQAFHAELSEAWANIATGVEELREVAVVQASRLDLVRYLEARIADWDYSPWLGGDVKPSLIEQRGVEGTLSTETVHADHQMVVIIGGPGAGKTWLARRRAREAAKEALARLTRLDPLSEVVIPVFTTWSSWSNIQGDTPRNALIRSSFSSGMGHSDISGHDRIARTLQHDGCRVLAIIDSLDEAAGIERQGHRLRELKSISDWQIIVTSRPESWAANSSVLDSKDYETIELVDLQYPHDVELVIESWFVGESTTARSLMQLIERRPELRRTCGVPLLLTFYCIAYQLSNNAGQMELPSCRRDLYNEVIDLLLLGGWGDHAPGSDAQPDPELCHEVLKTWAWESIQGADSPADLGAWPDTFSPRNTPPGLRRALDNVAPKVRTDARGRIHRRFLHRTLLEHFVAEYLATIPAEDAASHLLPHLWFDPDWSAVVPASIAAHPQGAQVLRCLRANLPTHPLGGGQREACEALDTHLLAAAAESPPSDWDEPERSYIHGLRIGRATREPDLILRSSETWVESNAEVRVKLLPHLMACDRLSFANLARVFFALHPDSNERMQAWARVLEMLAPGGRWATGGLLDALPGLEPTTEERDQARPLLLKKLLFEPYPDRLLRQQIIALSPTIDDKAKARAEVNPLIPSAHIDRLVILAGLLSDLSPTREEVLRVGEALVEGLSENDHGNEMVLNTLVNIMATQQSLRQEACKLLLSRLATADKGLLPRLASTLFKLDPTASDSRQVWTALVDQLSTGPGARPDFYEALIAASRAAGTESQTRKAMLAALPTSDLNTGISLVIALIQLAPSLKDAKRAHSWLLSALANASGVGLLMKLLLRLNPDQERQEQIRVVLLGRLPRAISTPDASLDPYERRERLAVLLDSLIAVSPGTAIRQVRAALLNGLPHATSATIRVLSQTLRSLDASPAELAPARRIVTATLSAQLSSSGYPDERLLSVLGTLGPTDADRRQVRAALLAALTTSEGYTLPSLAKALKGLDPAPDELRQAREALLAALTRNEKPVLPATRALAAMHPKMGERRQLRTLLVRQLATYSASTSFPKSSEVEPLADLLVDLCNTADERNETRTELLQTIPTTWIATHCMEALMRMEPTDAERLQAAAGLIEVLSARGNYPHSTLVESLLTLSSTEAVRVRVRSWLLPIFEKADRSSVVTLTDLLLALSPNPDEACAVKATLATHMASGTSFDAPRLMESFLALKPTREERLTAGLANLDRLGNGWEPGKDIFTLMRSARTLLPITDWLAWVNSEATVESTASMLASDSSNGDSPYFTALLKLAESSDELRRRALNRVMVLLPSTRTHGVMRLAKVATELGASGEQLGQIVERLVDEVGSAESEVATQLGGMLIELIPSSDNLRSRAAHRVLAIMPSAGTKSSRQLVRALSGLIESSDDLRDSAMDGLPWAHLAITSCLEMAFSELGMSAEERHRAVNRVLNESPSIGLSDAYAVVKSLADAGMSESQIECLVEWVLEVVSSAAPWLGSMIVNDMARAGAAADQRARLAHALLDRVEDLGPTYRKPVFRTLKHLADTPVWQRWVQDHGLSVEEAAAE